MQVDLAPISRTSVLLVAMDYDGTLARIVSDPAMARIEAGAVAPLERLAKLPQTHVAILSGRSRADLAHHLSGVAGVHLVGSHGAEMGDGLGARLSAAAVALRNRCAAAVEAIAEQTPGTLVEEKPAGVAFHYRNAEPQAGLRAMEKVVGIAGRLGELHIRHGKMVVELSVVATNKGLALGQLRRALGATGVVFVGDDLTDEDALATLSGEDVGVKVGTGQSVARFRVADTGEVVELLVELARLRAELVRGRDVGIVSR